MYKDTVTVFNRLQNPLGDTWYPTVLHGVNINVDKAQIVKQYGAESADNVVLNIHTETDDGKTVVGGKTLLTPKEWQRCAEPAEAITFAAGSAFDFFWVGEWEGTSAISDDNYGDASFYDYMLSQYDLVFGVTGIGLFSVIPHLEVIGK